MKEILSMYYLATKEPELELDVPIDSEVVKEVILSQNQANTAENDVILSSKVSEMANMGFPEGS
jgi:hypothetical protein